jgi:nucleoside-diphosphate-sugar epimerase
LKIVVTGYRGFIASHLIPELKHEELSLIEREDYPPNEKIEGADAIVHLGAISGARPDVLPYGYLDYNVKRTVDLLEAARLAGTKKFVFISTCTVSHGVKNIYDVSKQQGEQWCSIYRNYIADVPILRLYNVYGEGDTKSVIAKFVSAIENGRPIVIHGDGRQTRDFINVRDVVQAIKKALYARERLNEAIEVGTGKEESIRGLANILFRIMGKKVPIEYGPLPYEQLRSAKCPEPLFVKNPIPLEEGLKLLLKA